ncbi:MAG: tetratricopeptide repeat protein [Alkalispirochaeta sp.]
MKRGKGRSLGKAARLFRRRQYTYVINLLEPQVFMFRESWYYYHLLGMSCMYTGDYAGAYSYLRRAADLDPDRVETLLGIGAVLLRRRQIDLAIRHYLDTLDQHPRERRARRALQWIRTLSEPDEVVEWFESDRIRKILPPRGWYLPTPISIAAVLAALVAIAVYLVPPAWEFVEERYISSAREGSDLLEFEEQPPATGPDASASEERFVFTPEELEDHLQEIQRLFNDSRDNLVRRELNRILLSNADPSVKRRAELLREYLTVPDFASMGDTFSVTEVLDDPELYRGTFVRWRGRLANLSVTSDAITFDLLVGYESGRVLDGIVPVHVPFAVVLDDGQGVELIGEIRRNDGGESPISLVARDVRRLGASELNAPEGSSTDAELSR